MRLSTLTEIALVLTAAGILMNALLPTAKPTQSTDKLASYSDCAGALRQTIAKRRILIPACSPWSTP